MGTRTTQDAPETQALRRRCLVYASLMREFMGRMDPAVDAALAEMPERIRRSPARGLRDMERDFLEMMRGWTDVHGTPTEERRLVEERLRRELGLSLESLLRGELASVQRILKRGLIRNEDEYRLLVAWVDDWDSVDPQGTACIAALIDDYGTKPSAP